MAPPLGHQKNLSFIVSFITRFIVVVNLSFNVVTADVDDK